MDNQILTLMVYIKPKIEIDEVDFALLSGSGPDATSIGSPSVNDNVKECSIWDEVNEQYNNKEEQNYEEDWI